MRWMVLFLSLAGAASAQTGGADPAQPRPPAPPTGSIAAPDHPGWTVDARNGCWVWNPNPQQEETVIWTGLCPEGPATGEGLLAWRYIEGGEPRGERYLGTMARGRMHGIGTYLDSAGETYQGEWQEGREEGHGLRVWATGRYEGGWHQGMRQGRGMIFWINGNLFRGEFKEDRPDGPGEYFSVEAGWFRGTWAEGCFREGDRQAAIGRPVEECP